MARPVGHARVALNCTVQPKNKTLLEAKAKIAEKSMSDLVDDLIDRAFSPKRGLAKRIADQRAKAESMIRQTAYEAAEITAAADLEWDNSFQAMALQYLDNSEQKDLDLANFWLFEHRVLAAKDKFGVWHSGGSAYKAAYSFMNSTMTPDKLLAADLAAEGEMYELPADAFDYIVSCYEGCVRKAFEAFDAPIASEELRQFHSVALDCDSMYGTKAAANLESRLEVANKVTIDWAKKRVDLMLKQGLTPSEIYNDLALSPELRQRGKELMNLQQLDQ